jgi:3-oxoacyl-[acyl-carrier-protein] synthase III
MVIESIGAYLPEKAVTTQEIVAGCARPLRFPLERMSGIQSRRVAGGEEFSVDLARKAALDCLARSRHSRDDVDLLICCNISRLDAPSLTSFEPSTAARLRGELNLDRAATFDVNNACAGMFTGLYVAAAFLETGAVRNAMIVSGEYISHLSETAQREIDGFLDPRLACLTLGDAGAAVMVTRTDAGHAGFREFDLYTLGRYANYCIGQESERSPGRAIMLTDAVKLSAVLVKEAVAHGIHVQRRGGWPPDGFDYLIPHQTSRTTLQDAARETNRLYEREVWNTSNVVNNVQHRGNTASTSHFVAVMDWIQSGRLQAGDHVVFSITGSGVTIGTAAYSFDDLPDRLRNGTPPDEAARPPAAQRSMVRPAARRARIRAATALVPMSPEESSFDLAGRAGAEALRVAQCAATDVELLIHTGIYRTGFLCEPAVAALVAGKLGMNDDVPAASERKTLALDLLNGATGFLNACEAATRFVESGKCGTAMIVASEIENNDGREGCDVSGVCAGASAFVVEDGHDGEGFGGFLFRNFPDLIDEWTARAGDDPRSVMHFHRGPRLQESLLERFPPVVDELLAARGLRIDDIARILPPQLSPAFVASFADRLGVPRDRVVDASDAKGDWFTSSLPRGWLRAHELAPPRRGDVWLLVTAGSGLQIGCALYHF